MSPFLPTERLINALQSYGVRLADSRSGVPSRRGGAGPSDHKAMTIAGRTVMVPVHTASAFDSPYLMRRPIPTGSARSSTRAWWWAGRRCRASRGSTRCRPSTGCPIRKSPCFTGAMCSPPRCSRPASATRAEPRPAASARSGNRSRRPHDCTQEPGAARRGRPRRGAARRRQAHGDDDGHAERHRPRRGGALRERRGGQKGRRPADPGAVRAAGR